MNQRAFVVAQNMLNPGEKVQFITKGFDWLGKNVDGHIKAKFNPNKFNPYTCAKERSLYSVSTNQPNLNATSFILSPTLATANLMEITNYIPSLDTMSLIYLF